MVIGKILDQTRNVANWLDHWRRVASFRTRLVQNSLFTRAQNLRRLFGRMFSLRTVQIADDIGTVVAAVPAAVGRVLGEDFGKDAV